MLTQRNNQHRTPFNLSSDYPTRDRLSYFEFQTRNYLKESADDASFGVVAGVSSAGIIMVHLVALSAVGFDVNYGFVGVAGLAGMTYTTARCYEAFKKRRSLKQKQQPRP